MAKTKDARTRLAFEIYLSGQAHTIDEAADKAGMSRGHLRAVAGREKWIDRRNAIDEKAARLADERLAKKQADRLTRFREETLQLADALKVKALEALSDPDPEKAMTQGDAVKAIRAAVSIQATALGLDRGKPADEGGLTLQQIVINGGTPAGLNPGDVALELTDDELARIASKPRIIEPAPRPAAPRLEGPGSGKRGPGHGGKRAAAPAPGKG